MFEEPLKDDKNPSLNWRVTVGPITCDYMQGIAHMPGYEQRNTMLQNERRKIASEEGLFFPKYARSRFGGKKIKQPDLTDVLWSLVMDAEAVEYSSFEEWAETYGYDTDSREAEKIYRQCLEIGLKLRQIINLDEAREVFQDY